MWRKVKFIATHKAYYAEALRRYAPVLQAQAFRRRKRNCPAGIAYLDISVRTNRSLFNLVWILARSGFRIIVPHNVIQLGEMGECDKWIFGLPEVSLTRHSPEETGPRIIVTDRPDRYDSNSGHTHVIDISFDFYHTTRAASVLRLPFGCHPRARLKGLCEFSLERKTDPRALRLFFAGNISAPEYKKSELTQIFGILNRSDFIQVVEAFLKASGNNVQSNARVIDQGPSGHGLSMKDYFLQLNHSSFVLCPPGVNHPQCHNLEEGMMQGAIPILEYGNLLATPLSDGENCLAFKGADGLNSVLERAFSMAEHEIAAMRVNVLEYAREFLDPRAFASRLCDNSIKRLLMLNEAQSTKLLATKS